MPTPDKNLKPASLNEARRMGALVGVAPFIRPKTYIGGTRQQARDKYWQTDNDMYILTDSVARRYGINPELLRSRMDAEGYTDQAIKDINAEYVDKVHPERYNRTFTAPLGEQKFNSLAMPYVAGEEFGLDDVATYIKDGRVHLINENWGDGSFQNEKGRWTNIAIGNNYSDNIGLMAATLKAMRNQAKKDFPNASGVDLDRYAGAYYNRGITGGKKYVQNKGKGYKVRRTLEDGGAVDDSGLFGNERIDNVASFLPILGTLEDAYAFYKDPSWANAGWLAASLGSDIFTGGAAGRAIKALRMANKAHDAAQAANKAAKATWKASKRSMATGTGRGADNLRTIRSLQAAGATRQAAIRRANDALYDAALKIGIDQGVNGFLNAAQLDMLPDIRSQRKEGGSIHIAPSKRGTFTAAAKKHGLGVQAFASRVLANKDNYSPAMVKKANFARNASKWHH